MKNNLDSIQIAQVKPERCEFPSSIEGVPPYVLYLKPLSSIAWDEWRVRRAELVAKYVEGGWTDAAGAYQQKPVPFIMGSGANVPHIQPMNEDTLGKIAKLEAMQPDSEDKYVIEDILPIIIKDGGAWDLMQVKMITVQMSYVPGKPWPVPLETQTKPSSDTDSPT